jgi:hypothetical protein
MQLFAWNIMILYDPDIEPKKICLFVAIFAALKPVILADLRIFREEVPEAILGEKVCCSDRPAIAGKPVGVCC